MANFNFFIYSHIFKMTILSTILPFVLLFFIGFFGDLATQVVAKFSVLTNLFSPFWEAHGPVVAAVIAGFITMFFGGIIYLTSIGVYNYFDLNTKGWSFILFSTMLGFAMGVVIDLIVNRNNLIPTLRKWYTQMGDENAALWSGGLTFAFAAFVSTFILSYTN